MPDPETTVGSHSASVRGKRRWVRWPLLIAVVLSLVAFAYRGSTTRRIALIRELGGVVRTGPRPIFYDLTAPRRSPSVFQGVLKSKAVTWVFQQFPVVYGIDLRGVKDAKDVGTALEAARGFEHLHELTLYQSGVTDEHLAILSTGFPSLTHLKINETAITDEGIRHLRDLPALQLVNAQRTAITDAAVPDLAAIRRLKELSIGETGITSAQAVQESHPECRIYSEFVHTTRCRACMQMLNYCVCRKTRD
jgi:hypothetical protein